MFFKELLLGIGGVVAILVGSELIIRAAKVICRKFCISEYYIGLTVLSIGTSLPEIFTHVIGSIRILQGHFPYESMSGIILGSNIGSNFVQITFIMGVVGLFAVIHTTKAFLKVDYSFSFLQLSSS